MKATSNKSAADRIVVEQATPDDAIGMRIVIRAAMKKYIADSGIPGSLDSIGESVDDLLRYIGQDTVFVARLEQNILGTVRVSVEPDGDAYISRFAVLPGNQSLGIGSRLFAAAEAYVAEKRYLHIFLHTALSNEPLVRFYKSRGFHLSATSTDRGYPRGLLVKVMGVGNKGRQA